MTTNALDGVIRRFRRAALERSGTEPDDGELLRRFVEGRDGEAFAALVYRHGPMVLGVCRRVLRNEADAEDAFQATFLVLVSKAATVRPREMVGNWLYGVARNTATKAKAMNTRRTEREREAGAVTRRPAPDEAWQDVLSLLDEELGNLPDKYRAPIVLCDLEGKTIAEAAVQLGWPQGTLATRLRRGRELLARRLSSRGVSLTAGLLSVVAASAPAAAGVPPALSASTIEAAGLVAAGRAVTSGVASATVAALTQGVLKSMTVTKAKTATAVVVLILLGGLGSAVALSGGHEERTAPANSPASVVSPASSFARLAPVPPGAGVPEVHVIGVSEGKYPPENKPMPAPVPGGAPAARAARVGAVVVKVRDAKRPVVLVLTARASVAWKVEAPRGAVVRVIASGYFRQSVEGLDKEVPVTLLSYEEGDKDWFHADRKNVRPTGSPCPDEERDEVRRKYDHLLERVKGLTGREPTAFHAQVSQQYEFVVPGRSPSAVRELPAAVPPGSEVHAVGVYEGTSPPGVKPGGDDRPEGVVRVKVAAGKNPVVLLLTSCEPVAWKVEDPGGAVVRVFASGYHKKPTVEGLHKKVPIHLYSGGSGDATKTTDYFELFLSHVEPDRRIEERIEQEKREIERFVALAVKEDERAARKRKGEEVIENGKRRLREYLESRREHMSHASKVLTGLGLKTLQTKDTGDTFEVR